jgi:YD repeat-containing protein
LSLATSGTYTNPTSLQDLSYVYDQAGNVSTISDALAGSPQVQSFTYDSLNRLVSAEATDGQNGMGITLKITATIRQRATWRARAGSAATRTVLNTNTPWLRPQTAGLSVMITMAT